MAVWEGALRLSIIPAGGIRQSSQTSNMKRKLDTDNVPNEASAPSQASDPSANTFADFGLDSRILQGVVKEKFAKPTSVQAKAIPLALDGKDILGVCPTFNGLGLHADGGQLAQKLAPARPRHTCYRYYTLS